MPLVLIPTDTVGRSPRARGRQFERGRAAVLRRKIPACAGPTRAPDRRTAHDQEDPRVRGADTLPLVVTPTLVRKIPACAGPTCRSRCSTGCGTEDPRVRGADARSSAASLNETGRSPRARGRRADAPPGGPQTRKIPACAGPTR
ncbi:hypothetical protein STTU_p0076 (plasmid) [Streptomyces sp. Tu6071]|nr:hypothetical protein STTU_p0076 [Streptomyces sp. Tu6071]